MLGRRAGSVGAAGLAVALSLAGSVQATDHPVDAQSLSLRRSGARERLLFVSRDPGLAFPALGGPDDPTSGGALIELFSAAEGAASFAVPAGSGTPGWQVSSDGQRYRFSNSAAPGGPSPVRVVVLKQGRLLKVAARATGLPLAVAQGSVAIRVTTGALRSCALFGPATVRRDVPGHFVARRASAAALTDCGDASLGAPTTTTTTTTTPTTTVTTTTVTTTTDTTTTTLGYTCAIVPNQFQCAGTCPPDAVCAPTASLDSCHCVSSSSPCGGTYPVCNGTCGDGEDCQSVGTFPFSQCECVPIGQTACGNSAAPACGGVCPAGEVCYAFFGGIQHGQLGCGCAEPGPCGAQSCMIGGECPPGWACAVIPGSCFCAPIP